MPEMLDLQTLGMALQNAGAQQQAQQAQQGTILGQDPEALRSIGLMLAEALDPQGFGGNLARGTRKLQQSQILGQERERQQQGLHGALGLTPDGVPGPTKMTIDANGRVTTVGNVGPNGPVQGFTQSGMTGGTGQTQTMGQQFQQPTVRPPEGLPQQQAGLGGGLQSPFPQAQRLPRAQDLAGLLR